MATITLTEQEWDDLSRLAQEAVASDTDASRTLAGTLLTIEARSGITRYELLVRWVEVGAPLPAGTVFPTSWPPSYQLRLRKLNEPILKADVTDAVAARARRSTASLMVTEDPAGIVGWTLVDDYFA